MVKKIIKIIPQDKKDQNFKKNTQVINPNADK